VKISLAELVAADQPVHDRVHVRRGPALLGVLGPAASPIPAGFAGRVHLTVPLATPKCRHEHRLKQHPQWKAEQLTPSTIRWTTPSGRQYTTEPTRYPI